MLESNTAITHTTLSEKTDNRNEWRTLFLFNLYRLTVSLTILATFLFGVVPGKEFQSFFQAQVFFFTSCFYLVITILFGCIIWLRWSSFNVQVLVQGVIDILLLLILIHSSGGLSSGLGMLLVVAIAGGSLLTEGRTAFFLAAVASLGVLLHVALADLYASQTIVSFTHAGLLGMTFFATALLAHFIARRIRASEALAKQRGLDVQYLAQLNAQIVQHIQSGIIVVDIVDRVRLFNEAARRLLGLHTQPNGRLLSVVIPELGEFVKIWRTGGTNSQLFRPSKGEVEIIATLTPLNQGGAASVLIVLEDATLTAQRAQQLKLASLGRLTASIAHEVRNPLGAISHAGQLLAEVPDLPKEQMHLVHIIGRHCRRVNTIIESVLQLSRRTPTTPEQFELCDWLQGFVEELITQHGLQTSDLVLDLQRQPLNVTFDRNQLYQVLDNLCDNGLRYSRGKPLLEISIGTSEELNRPYLDVCDHGPGMAEDVASQIFEPFFTTENKGTGLGLYIAREICEANRASLQMWRNTQQGCCFRVYFTDSNL